MKKLLILAGLLAVTCSTQVFANENAAPNNVEKTKPSHCQCHRDMHRPKCDFNKFEDELGLTAKQKEQAKQLREKQMEAAKPIFEQLKQKEAEAQALRQQLRDLREQNKKEFESILTDKQLKKLNEMKAERKAKAKHHKHKRPPMHNEQRGCQK